MCNLLIGFGTRIRIDPNSIQIDAGIQRDAVRSICAIKARLNPIPSIHNMRFALLPLLRQPQRMMWIIS